MKWFKHDTSANMDGKLQEILLDYGLEGYGLYWYCLELISAKVSKENITFQLEHDARMIARNTGSTADKVQEMMERFISLGLFENNGGNITCLKMAKRIDQSMTSNPEIRKIIAMVGNNHDFSANNHDSVMTKSSKPMIKSSKIMETHDSVKQTHDKSCKPMPDKIRLDKNRLDTKRDVTANAATVLDNDVYAESVDLKTVDGLSVNGLAVDGLAVNGQSTTTKETYLESKQVNKVNIITKRFKKPSVEEIESYMTERAWTDPSQQSFRFLDYYESNGWRVGKSAMKDWKAAVRNWERNNTKKANGFHAIENKNYGQSGLI